MYAKGQTTLPNSFSKSFPFSWVYIMTLPVAELYSFGDKWKPQFHSHFVQHKSHMDRNGIKPGPPRWDSRLTARTVVRPCHLSFRSTTDRQDVPQGNKASYPKRYNSRVHRKGPREFRAKIRAPVATVTPTCERIVRETIPNDVTCVTEVGRNGWEENLRLLAQWRK